MERSHRDITGLKFNRLTAISYIGDGRWACQCDCGKSAKVSISSLENNRTKSCGCYRLESGSSNSITHGRSYSPEYLSWAAMKDRCLNPNNIGYSHYGGRGIKICDRWINSFENFLEDMGEKPTPTHSIERDRVNEGYEPSNCRWVTPNEQKKNRTDSRWIEYNGERMILVDWAKRLQMDKRNLHRDLKKRNIAQIIEKRAKK